MYPMMTTSSRAFVTPLSVATVAGNPVEGAANDTLSAEIDHIQSSRKVDCICVAPCSANFMASMAHGIASDVATATVLAADAPVFIAPSMNPKMWENPATQKNAQIIKSHNITLLGPALGQTVCNENGIGRMCEPEHICDAIDATLTPKNTWSSKSPLRGKRYLITLGATIAHIDPVRVITNLSSGRQGASIATELLKKGAIVTIIKGNTLCKMPQNAIVLQVKTTKEMCDATKKCLPVDGAIFCAAATDYKVLRPKKQKIKKTHNILTIELTRNPDILLEIATHKQRPKIVVGFAAETENVVENATTKLYAKHCDVIVANRITEDSFKEWGTDVHMVDKREIHTLGTLLKTDVAVVLVKYLEDKTQHP